MGYFLKTKGFTHIFVPKSFLGERIMVNQNQKLFLLEFLFWFVLVCFFKERKNVFYQNTHIDESHIFFIILFSDIPSFLATPNYRLGKRKSVFPAARCFGKDPFPDHENETSFIFKGTYSSDLLQEKKGVRGPPPPTPARRSPWAARWASNKRQQWKRLHVGVIHWG